MGTRGFPLFDLGLAGSRFHGWVCTPSRLRRREAVLRETPPTPSSRVTSLRRQRSNQERRPRFTGPLIKLCLIKGLPCAARIGRPAQNSPAARAQTAAPEGPAQCCAARRLRRGFPEPPSVAGRAGVIGGQATGEGRKAKGEGRRAKGEGRRAKGEGRRAKGEGRRAKGGKWEMGDGRWEMGRSG